VVQRITVRIVTDDERVSVVWRECENVFEEGRVLGCGGGGGGG
jgi:hypothetical protein